MVERIAQAGSDFEPGAQMSYSNSGYMLLAYILEHLHGKPYGEILDSLIVRPLGLTNTFNAQKIDPSRGEARSYDPVGGWQYAPKSDPSALIGAGSVVSTPSDLIKFHKALRAGFFGDGIYEQMSEKIDGWGRGLCRYFYMLAEGMGHNGGIEGFQSVFCNLGNIDFAICANAIDVSINNDVLMTLMQAAAGTDYIIPEFGTPATFDSLLIKSFTGIYTSEPLGLDMEISNDSNMLFGQATGQMKIPFQALVDTSFVFYQGNIKIKFSSDNSKLTLYQNGGEFEFVRKQQ